MLATEHSIIQPTAPYPALAGLARRRSGLAATRPEVLSALSRILWESLRLRYRRWAKGLADAKARVETGAFTGVHRAGASLNVHVHFHFHVLCLDGVYVEDGDMLGFALAPAPIGWRAPLQRAGSSSSHRPVACPRA